MLKINKLDKQNRGYFAKNMKRKWSFSMSK